ncbi:cyclic nucleotide-binding domain-containing protein [Sphingosinicella sp. CPCC 101087]|uniref:cyclic nucleotide-binding domain-containing protein n=1 Tax=Sphingosinicella sp. CPCC 101087 TaxID=2497754 RepID=UPI0013EB5292|nr:cyclic nucleotide-binding domain-containing protein [Sphingosinicella sp. CPCC 101087]
MLSADALLLQLSYALLVAAVLAARPAALRVLVALAALVGLTRALIWTGDVVTAVWMGLLLGACLTLLARNFYESRHIRFTPEERRMLDSLVAGVSQSRARHLIDQGIWLNGKEGDVLTREGQRVDHLYFLAEGEARVMSMGRHVGTCRPGDLIGELTVLSGETASATVILTGPARFWCAPADDLRPYVEAHDDIRRAIEHGFATALKSKLRASNRAIAEAGGVHPGSEPAA